MIRQVNTAIPSRSFGRVCIINNMYGLLQYLLISSLEELEDTFFFFDDDVPDVLVSNYKNWTKMYTPTSAVGKLRYLLELRYVVRKKYPFLKTAEIYGQDNLLLTPPLLANRQMTVVEDGVANYTLIPPKRNFRLIKRLVIGPLMSQSSLGYSTACKKLYLTGMAPIPEVLRPKVEIINLQELWNNSDQEKQTEIMRLFSLSPELLNVFKKTTAILLTQPLSEDGVITEEEKIQIYRQILEKGNILLKPHPRDRTDYRKLFPEVMIMPSFLPIELLSLAGVRFENIYTIFSSSALSFPGNPEIHFLGTRIHPALVKKYGDIRYIDGKVTKVDMEG